MTTHLQVEGERHYLDTQPALASRERIGSPCQLRLGAFLDYVSPVIDSLAQAYFTVTKGCSTPRTPVRSSSWTARMSRPDSSSSFSMRSPAFIART